MALIKCPECGKMFSEYAEHCPECGCPTEDAKAANKENDSPTSQNIEETESDKYISSNVADNFEAKTLSQESIKPSTEDDRDTVEGKDSIRKLLLYIGIIIVIMIGSIIANHVYTKKNEEHAKAEQEQLILERAQYIFDNLPDHKAIEDVDGTVFTPSFLTVLKKNNEQVYSFDDTFYWYTGNESHDESKLLGIDVTKIENDTAYVKVIYWNFEADEHTMRMVRMNGQWYCDEWDNKKETLSQILQEQAEQEQLILERAHYIFDNLPDHRAIEDVDKTVFTPSFLTVLEKANELDAADPQDLSFEDAFYWYQGNEIDDGKLIGIDVTKIEDDTAYVKVIYKNYEEEEHTMRMVRMDEQWYCDEWDNKKETLSNLCERVESNYIDD